MLYYNIESIDEKSGAEYFATFPRKMDKIVDLLSGIIFLGYIKGFRLQLFILAIK